MTALRQNENKWEIWSWLEDVSANGGSTSAAGRTFLDVDVFGCCLRHHCRACGCKSAVRLYSELARRRGIAHPPSAFVHISLFRRLYTP